jgi:hypothetical protein
VWHKRGEKPGIVWLADEEEKDYKKGRRVFPKAGVHMASKFYVQ